MIIMEQDNEYEKFVTMIEEIETTSKKESVAYIDISEMVNKTQLTPQRSYLELIDIINDVESGGRRPKEMPQERMIQPMPQIVLPKPGKKVQKKQAEPEAQPQTSTPDHLITSGVAQTQFTQVNIVKPNKEEKKQFGLFQKPPSTTSEAAESRKNNVVNELGAIASKLTSMKPNVPELKRRKVNIKDLVLPNLSIADQISELERIIEGLKEHVFDTEHIDIVTQEIYGLQQTVNDSKKKMKGKISEMHSLEQSLWQLRDERLEEATALLLQSGAS